MNTIRISLIILMSSCLCSLYAENIDPHNEGLQYAYGANVGWLNFEPDQGPGVQVSSTDVRGYVWAENIGWINLSPLNYAGVANDGSGNLSGYAWGENVGWINFAPSVPPNQTDYGVKIDADGNFSGYAWGENIGWINFALIENHVAACKVTIDDLENMARQWLYKGSNNSADLNGDSNVDLLDLSILAVHWLDYSPNNWGI